MTDNTTVTRSYDSNRPAPRARAARVAGPLAAALLCAGCALAHPAGPPPARHTPRAGTPAADHGLAAILPFSPARLEAAAALAARFAAAYDTWSWQQPPAAWLAGLRPMTTAGLYAALAQAAATPGVLAQRAAARQAAAGTATAAVIRDLSPGSVTITVTISQVITSAAGTTRAGDSLAVALVPAGGGWAAWDIEPAAAGNN